MDDTDELPNTTDCCKSPSKVTKMEWSRRRSVKNLLCLSAIVFLLYCAYQGVTYLQSTMNSQESMGLASQALLNAVLCFSALLLPKITIRTLGCKSTLLLAVLLLFPYIASNFYPKWETLMPSAVLVGVSGSLFWSSICTYLNKIAALYNGTGDRESVASTATLFFGIFDMFYLSATATGNLLSFFILKDPQSDSSNTTHGLCGINFVEDEGSKLSNANLAAPDTKFWNILLGIYVCCALSTIFPLAMLDTLPKQCDEIDEHFLTSKLTATFRIMRQKRQLLLMPSAFYFGMQEAFYIGDFTREYIACAWGVRHVGLITMFQGFSAGLSSTLSGRLRRYTGRIPMYAGAALVNIVAFVQLFLWIPDSERPYMFFVVTMLWGMFYGIYYTQIRALYGDMFRQEEEGAFGNFYIWNSMGRILSFSYSNYLFVTTKLYVLTFVFCLAQLGYIILELDLRKSTREEKSRLLYKHEIE